MSALKLFVLVAGVFSATADNLPINKREAVGLLPPVHPDSEEPLDFSAEDEVEEYEYVYDPVEEIPSWMEDDACTPLGEETSCAQAAEESKCAWVPMNCRVIWRPECDIYATATKTLRVAMVAYHPDELNGGMVEKIAKSLFGKHRRLEDGYCCSQAPDCMIMDNDECGDHTNCEVTTHLTDTCTTDASCYSKDFVPPMPQCHLDYAQLPSDFLVAHPQGLDENSCGDGYFRYGNTGWEWDTCSNTKWFNKSRWYWPKKEEDYTVCKWKVMTGKCEVVRAQQY